MVSHEEEPFFDMLDGFTARSIVSLLTTVDSVRGLRNLRATCRQLRCVANSPEVWASVDVGKMIYRVCRAGVAIPRRTIDEGSAYDREFIACLAKVQASLRNVDLSMCQSFDCTFIPADVWRLLVRRMPNLRTITIHLGVAMLRDPEKRNTFADTLAYIQENCVGLEAVSIRSLNEWDVVPVVLPHVRSLRIYAPASVIDTLTMGCRELRDVKIAGWIDSRVSASTANMLLTHEATLIRFRCVVLADYILMNARSPTWPMLRALNVGMYTPEIMSWVGTVLSRGFGRLETLGFAMSRSTIWTDAPFILGKLAARPGLQLDLTLNDAPHDYCDLLAELGDNMGPRLCSLEVYGATQLPPAFAMRKLPNLRSVRLRTVSDKTANALAGGLLVGVPPPSRGAAVAIHGMTMRIRCSPGSGVPQGKWICEWLDVLTRMLAPLVKSLDIFTKVRVTFV
ncbi:MAG: hypothetical protein WC732_08730 [Candidatus Omnitrophota bacterium]